MTSAAQAQNSIAKSRSDTASSEFSHRPSKPSSRATRWRSIGKLVPASAAAPSGSRFTRFRTSSKSFAVALEHLHVRQQVVAEGHRLRHLQMGEARHDERGVALGLVEQRALAARRAACRSCVDLVAQPQAHVGRHLVVARARGVQALAGVADQRGQPPLDVEMHVLGVERPAEAPGVDLALDARQPALDRREVAPREDAAAPPACARGRASLDVILGQPPVEADRGGKALDPLVDGLRRSAQTRSDAFWA